MVTIVALPTGFGFSKVNSFQLQRAANQLRSKYTGQGQRIIYPYAIWMLDATLVECDGIKAGRFRSFLGQLEGIKNSFRLPVPGIVKPLTGYTGNGVANGAAAARASSIAIKSLTASVPVLAEGDYFTVNDELKLVTAAAASNASGQVTVSFKPELRAAVADGTTIYFQNPTVLMNMQSEDNLDIALTPPYRQNGKFQAVETV